MPNSLKKMCLTACLFCLPCLAIAQAQAPEGRIPVSFWEEVTGFELQALQAVVDDFNHSQTKIWVLLTSVPSVDQKTLVATAGGVPPDLADQSETNLPPLVEKNALVQLDDYVRKTGIHASNYIPVYWKEAQYKGHTWGIPLMPYLTALHWNKQAFREAGLDPNQPPKTIAELDEFSRRLTKRDENGNLLRAGFLPADPGWLTYSWVFYFGGDIWDGRSKILLNSPADIAAFKWVQSYAKLYGNSHLQAFRSGFGSYASAQNAFMAGKVAMVMDGVWLGNFIQQYAPHMDWGAAAFPTLRPGDDPVTMAGCNMLTIPRGAKHPEAAFAFMAYMSQQAPMEKLCLAEMKNSPLSHVSESFYKNHKNPFIRSFQRLAWSRHATHPPQVGIWNEIWTEMMATFDKIWLGQTNPRDALEETQWRLQGSLDQELEREGKKPSPFLQKAPFYLTTLALLGIGLVILRGELRARRFARQSGAGRIRGKLFGGLIFSAPGLIGLVVFVLFPILCSLVYSFCDYSVLTEPRWVGLGNFKALMADNIFWLSLKNSLLYAAAALPLGLLISFICAVLLDSKIKGTDTYRTLYFIPFITPLVASAMVWMWIFNTEYGVLNYLLKTLSFGLIKNIPWLTDAHFAMPSLVLMSLWGVGQTTVIMLAALQDVPVSIYEAADMDGANWWDKIIHISIPFISPVIYFNLMIGLIGALQVFAVPYIMTGGGPARATEFYSMYLWENAFNYLKMGYASAMAWILFLIILALTWFIYRFSEKRIHYTGA